MRLRKTPKVLRIGNPAAMFRLYPPEVHEETISPEQRISLSRDEVRRSGIMEIMTEVFNELHKEYLEGPLPTDTYRPLLKREVYEKAVSKILESSRPLKDDKAESSMDYKEVVDSIRPYATTIRSEEYHWGTIVYIILKELLVLVNSNDNRVMIVNDCGRNIVVYEDTSYLKPILLLDASSDVLIDKTQKLLLEIKSLLQAQEIYLNYAGIVADTLTSQYQGQTRVSHKGNRTTLHFYLSDTEKAVLTLFQEKMPWTLPDPPTDPQSLRKTCQEEGSPFFIVTLGKRDRKRLKASPVKDSLLVEYMRYASQFSDCSFVDWDGFSRMRVMQNVADWDESFDERIHPSWKQENLDAGAWALLQNAKAELHRRSIPVRALSSRALCRRMDALERSLDEAFETMVTQEYYHRCFEDVFDETVPPKVEGLYK